MTLSHRRLPVGAISLCLVFLAVLVAPAAAFAQTDEPPAATVTLDTLRIILWPEFDQPAVLVQYNGAVAGATGEAELRFTLPAGATFHTAAIIDPASGDLLDAMDVTTVEGNLVTMRSPNGTFHIEFYDPALDVSQEQRAYTYTWPGDYAVNNLTWEVQQPAGAENFAVDAADAVPAVGAFGLNYYSASASNLAAGQQAAFGFNYVKAGSGLTVETLPTQAPATDLEPSGAAEDSSTRGTTNTILIVALAALGVGLVGGGAYYYWRTVQGDRRGGRRESDGGSGVFCTQCGTEASSRSDKFCRKCGASLRRG